MPTPILNSKNKGVKNLASEKKNIFKNPVWACILAIFCSFLWGSAFPCIKIGYNLFEVESGDSASQILFAGIRFTIAGILALIMGSVTAKKPLVPHKSSLFNIFKLCLCQTVLQYIFFYIGLANTTAVNSSIIKGTGTFITIIIACFVFHQEKFTLPKLIGCVLGFAGIVMMNLNGGSLDSSFKLTGEGFILFANIAGAFSTAMIKKYSKSEFPVVLSGYQFTLGGIILTLSGLFMGGKLNTVTFFGILMLLYLAFISAAAYSIWGMLLKYNRLSKIAVYGFMTPVFGFLLSALLLRETQNAFELKYIAALALVCCGIIIVNKFREENKQ